jgi:hypothetical protein
MHHALPLTDALPLQTRPVQQVAPAPVQRPKKPISTAGWPHAPVYDPGNRAVTAAELNAVELESATWKTVCTDLMTKNQLLLETGTALPLHNAPPLPVHLRRSARRVARC